MRQTPPSLTLAGTGVCAARRRAFAIGFATLNGVQATTMPIGYGSGALFDGAQIIGGFLDDRTAIKFAGLIGLRTRWLHPVDQPLRLSGPIALPKAPF